MDTFYEQIIPVKKTVGHTFICIGIWLAAIIISLAAILFLFAMFTTIALVIVAISFYFAYKITGRYNVEYEYIITNNILDVDKIMSKSTRKRLLTFELSTVTRFEKFNPEKKETASYGTKVIACNVNDPNAYLLVASKQGGESVCLVMSPEERMKKAMLKFIPKHISNSVQ